MPPICTGATGVAHTNRPLDGSKAHPAAKQRGKCDDLIAGLAGEASTYWACHWNGCFPIAPQRFSSGSTQGEI